MDVIIKSQDVHYITDEKKVNVTYIFCFIDVKVLLDLYECHHKINFICGFLNSYMLVELAPCKSEICLLQWISISLLLHVIV